MPYPNDEAYEQVKADLAAGNELTFAHIGEVFGQDFWILLVYAFLDANDAARAIQGSMQRLNSRQGRKGKKEIG